MLFPWTMKHAMLMAPDASGCCQPKTGTFAGFQPGNAIGHAKGVTWLHQVHGALVAGSKQNAPVPLTPTISFPILTRDE